ncbi:TetR/AcrR family transcriptional regulator [Microbispora sp. NPDC049125]|uniref:TetR/AcrR family transcriptional regulator n=1 Tax=Microbispora sp. NPDC049125 TaxID=3154929 RepID=UPI0034661346
MAGRRRLAHDERRAAILRVAREMFSCRPYAAVSISDIAEAAGVSPPLIVFYYGTKRSLYLEVLQTAVTSITEGLRDVPGPPSLDRLRASVRFYAEYAREHRAGFLSLLRGSGESAIPEAAALVETLRRQVADRILADVAADMPPLDDATRTTLIVGIRGYLGYVDAAIALWLDLPDEQRAHVGPDTLADLAVGAFTGTLSALTAAAPASSRPGTAGMAGRPDS